MSGGRLMRVIFFWQLKFALLCGGLPLFYMGAYCNKFMKIYFANLLNKTYFIGEVEGG